MLTSMSGQTVVFLQTVCIGLCAGLLYDFFRVTRIYIAHSNLVIHAEDLLYWICVALGMLYVFLNRHYGEIRAFCFLGVALGMILYFTLLSPFIMTAACFVINTIRKVLNKVINILTFPIRALYRLLQPHFDRGAGLIKKGLQNLRNYVRIKILLFKRDIRVMLKKV